MAEFYSVSADPDLTGLVFSDGKLTRASVIKKAGYDAFAESLEALVQQLGQPRLEASSRSSIVMATWSTGGGERKTLSISRPVDAISVSFLDWIDRRACN